MHAQTRRVVTIVVALSLAIGALTRPGAPFTPVLAAPYVTGNLTYNNGSIMPNPTNYVIYWLPNNSHFEAAATAASDTNYENLVDRYFTDMCKGNALYNTMTQYSTNGGSTVTDGPIQNTCTFGGSYVDTTAFNAGTTGSADTTGAIGFSEFSLAVERAITHFSSGTGTNIEYFVYLPYQFNYCRSSTFCSFPTDSNNGFCAYHATYTGGASGSATKTYAINSTGLSGCSAVNGGGKTPNNDVVADSVIDVTSHEQFESVTNPNSGGWFFGDGSHENGDQCNFNFGTADNNADGTNAILNGNKYRLQWEWSNAIGSDQGGGDFKSSGCAPSYTDSTNNVCTSTDAVCPALPTVTVSSPTLTIPGNPGDDVDIQFNGSNGSNTDGLYSPTLTASVPTDFSPLSKQTTLPNALAVGQSFGPSDLHFSPASNLQNGTTYTFTGSLAGKDQLNAAVGPVSGSVQVKVVNPPPTWDPIGAHTVDYHDAITPFGVTAHDTDVDDVLLLSATGLPNGLHFKDNGDGTGTVSGTPDDVPGSFAVTFSVTDQHSSPVTQQITLTVNKEDTSLSYNGDTVIAAGSNTATLSAVLKEDSPVGTAPIGGGRAVVLTLGSGATSQSCTGHTDATGKASCILNPVTVPLGPQPISARFAGDAFYLLSDASGSATVFAFLKQGAFALGDKSAGSGTVTWWGAQWSSLNSLSGGSAPDAFKGFAAGLDQEPPHCGGTFTTGPGNRSSPPDARSIPSYMGVIVSSKVTKSDSSISGGIGSIVVVKTNAGYAGNPGHAGTGSVVATFCH